MCPLDAAKLRFGEGLGQFPLAQWLPAGLALALLEPKIIKQLLADPTNWHWPPTDDLRPSVLVPLMAKLAAAGIFQLDDSLLAPYERCRPTAVPRDPDRDRFIMDRRGPNGGEAK